MKDGVLLIGFVAAFICGIGFGLSLGERHPAIEPEPIHAVTP